MSYYRRPPEQVAILESWRERWESDGDVTYKMIAAEAGCTWPSVVKYASMKGWCRSPELHRQVTSAAGRKGANSRNAQRSAVAKIKLQDAETRRAAAPASVWDYGSLSAVVTLRGRHQRIEVTA